MMNQAVIIQARMSSERLPGKVLYEIDGRPLIGYMLDRLRRSQKIKKIIIATSSEASDDPIIDYCRRGGVEHFRGPLHNVAKRFRDAIRAFKLDSFVRLCGDSPLIDFRLIDEGIGIFERGCFDIATNVLRRTFPEGESFEIFRADIFLNGYDKIKDDGDREHVTSYFYKNPEKYKIYSFETNNADCSDIDLSINTKADLDIFGRILKKMSRPFADYNLEELVDMYKEVCRR